MAFTPGTRLGAYEITAQIGAGGMGVVYHATDTNLKRAVAIKVLPESVATDRDRLARFQREAEVLASLNHSNIAAIYGLERSDGVTALVMELVEGPTLADRIARGSIPIDEALSIAKQIAEALESAHEHGIIHRDLKPANIKLRNDGTVKVLDFGLAKAVEPTATAMNMSLSPTITSPAMMTGVGVLLGTAAYMAPEQARGKPVDKRTDIWAFGCVLYEMLTGKPPFSGETLTDVVAAIVKNEPDWDALPIAIPVLVRSVLRRCLQKDPVRRLQHAGDARIEIEEAIAEPAARPPIVSATRRRVWTGSMLPWVVAALASIGLVSQLGVGRSGSAASPVVRMDLNMPAGVEVATTASPNMAVSPDGTRIAFFGVTAGVRRLFVRRFDDFQATELRGAGGGNICFFSHDGRTLGFITTDHVLKKVSLADGLVTTLATDADFVAAGGVWGADDRIVFTRAGALWEIPGSGPGSARKLTTLDQGTGERAHAWPTVVAAGKVVLFTTVTVGPRTSMRIEALVRTTGERHVVVDSGSYPMYASSGHLVFYRDNALLAAPFDVDELKLTGPATAVVENIALDPIGAPIAALSSSGTLAYGFPGSATRRLVWVSRQGVESSINDTPRPYQNPRLGPDGNRIVVEVAGGDLYLQDLTRSTFTKLTSAGTVGASWAAWTPDSRLVFRTVAGLVLLDPDGGGQPQPVPETSVSDFPTFRFSGRPHACVHSASGEKATPICTSCLSTGPPKHVRSSACKVLAASSRLMGDGWRMCRTSRANSRSTFAPIPVPTGSSQCRRRAGRIRSGTGTVRNSSTGPAIG